MDLTMVYVSWDDGGGAVLRCHQHDAWELPLVGDNDSVPRVVEQAEQHVTETHRTTIDGELIEVTSHGDLARGERVYLDKNGDQVVTRW